MKEIKNQNHFSVNRQYKARIFEMLYEDKKELLDLYNAINETDYRDPDQLEINTLKNAIYMSMHNDISFVIGSVVSLYEHQSSFSPNLPLRFFFYMADVYSSLTREMNLYGEKPVVLPVPKFIIFYNGIAERQEREVLTLSALYDKKALERVTPDLQLQETLLNINSGYNEKLKSTCKSLGDYAEYTRRVREYAREMPIELAVDRAIDECIREGILANFLSRNKSEAKKVSIYEYDEEKHMRMERESSFADGLKQGIQQGVQQGIQQGVQQGIQQGLDQGQRNKLLQQIEKKLAKGKSVSQIAEDLEEPESVIEELIKQRDKNYT